MDSSKKKKKKELCICEKIRKNGWTVDNFPKIYHITICVYSLGSDFILQSSIKSHYIIILTKYILRLRNVSTMLLFPFDSALNALTTYANAVSSQGNHDFFCGKKMNRKLRSKNILGRIIIIACLSPICLQNHLQEQWC